jgi:hypothetical protein
VGKEEYPRYNTLPRSSKASRVGELAKDSGVSRGASATLNNRRRSDHKQSGGAGIAYAGSLISRGEGGATVREGDVFFVSG